MRRKNTRELSLIFWNVLLWNSSNWGEWSDAASSKIAQSCPSDTQIADTKNKINEFKNFQKADNSSKLSEKKDLIDAMNAPLNMFKVHNKETK